MTFEEFPVFVPLGEEFLCGVVCAPTDGMLDLGAVLLTGGNYTRSHRNRMWVRVARALAARGFPSIRIDYHGVGDSTGTARLELEAPFAEDALRAAEFLRRATDVSRLSMVATCYGGRTAVAAAARDPHVVSATLFPVRIVIPSSKGPLPRRLQAKRWLRRRSWGRKLLKNPSMRRVRAAAAAGRDKPNRVVSPSFASDVASFLSRGEIRFVYGEHSADLPDLRWFLAELKPRLTDDQHARMHLEVLPGTDLDRFQSLGDQELVVTRAVASVEETYRTDSYPIGSDVNAT